MVLVLEAAAVVAVVELLVLLLLLAVELLVVPVLAQLILILILDRLRFLARARDQRAPRSLLLSSNGPRARRGGG